jgi:hypothetical protein
VAAATALLAETGSLSSIEEGSEMVADESHPDEPEDQQSQSS